MAEVTKKKRGFTAPKGNKFALGKDSGRPAAYRPEYAEQAKKLCQIGATDAELANFFKVSQTTIYNWRLAYPEFLESIVDGKAYSDERMKRSLYQRGLGYDVPSLKVEEQLIDGEMIVTKRVTSATHIPGDVGAQKMWLTNRKAKEWREKVEHVHETGPEMTSAQALEELVALLVENGVQIAMPPPTIEGEIQEVVDGTDE